jgi:hypothetical protein
VLDADRDIAAVTDDAIDLVERLIYRMLAARRSGDADT